ncbi:hypothetical protein [Actinoplanes sp. NPDC049118]|uniref:hypothetical protein n=1 Tax=Actinoplanes sp. NPDC049118 TaxID=3155769 RepID=UPI0033D18691
MTASSSPEPLPIRWAVIFLCAALFGVIVGGFTLAQTAGWPAAILAALVGAGPAVPALHRILGR